LCDFLDDGGIAEGAEKAFDSGLLLGISTNVGQMVRERQERRKKEL